MTDQPPPHPLTQSGPQLARNFERDDVGAGLKLIGAMAVLGVLAGVLWLSISSHSAGFVTGPHQVIPDETEQFISSDGRFTIITGVIGLVAGGLCWARRDRRGPILAAALAIGTTIGAGLTALTGRLFGGGHTTGAVNSAISLPISVHARGLLAVEGGLALLVYLIATLMSAPDDLGRPPAAPSNRAEPDRHEADLVAADRFSGPRSVQPGTDDQHPGWNGHGPHGGEDGQFPA